MKIRIKDASIRLRLSMDDMQALAQEGRVVATCPVAPASVWEYALVASETGDTRAVLSKQGMEISIPATAAAEIADLSTVGHSFLIDNGTSAGLSLLVERDFKCLVDRPGEEESKLYPNPLAK